MSAPPDRDAHRFFGAKAEKYGEQYASDNLKEFYPEHVFRLRIFLDRLAAIKPRRILDVGSGSGEPLLAFLRAGYDAHGFDYSSEMVEQSKRLLSSNGLDEGRISQNNMEEIRGIKPGEFDCVVGLGSLYYSKVFQSTIKQISDLLPEGGNAVFSLRNELFSLFSLNSYTADFYCRNLIPFSSMSPGLRDRAAEFLGNKLRPAGFSKKFLTIDDNRVHSLFHNPLTVEKEVLAPNGLSLAGLYYYHYHALPPEFEHSDTEEFRKLSFDLENPSDWRGMFMCSTFVVHARK